MPWILDSQRIANAVPIVGTYWLLPSNCLNCSLIFKVWFGNKTIHKYTNKKSKYAWSPISPPKIFSRISFETASNLVPSDQLSEDERKWHFFLWRGPWSHYHYSIHEFEKELQKSHVDQGTVAKIASFCLVFLGKSENSWFWFNWTDCEKMCINRAMEKVALESKSRRGSGGSYEFFQVRLTKAWHKYFQ